MRRRYSRQHHNNGRIFLSQRVAKAELGSHHNEIARWFRELVHYGFIVKTAGGALGVDGKGRAPHWRLTELGYMNDLPTRDFADWDGRKFKPDKTESRAGNGARGVPEMAHTTVPENRAVRAESVPEMAHIQLAPRVPEMAHISRLPSPSPEAVALAPTSELSDIINRPWRAGGRARR